jgi:hypothetical protein
LGLVVVQNSAQLQQCQQKANILKLGVPLAAAVALMKQVNSSEKSVRIKLFTKFKSLVGDEIKM